jgi:RNA polymerase sigma-70 factor (ECF subfamily)
MNTRSGVRAIAVGESRLVLQSAVRAVRVNRAVVHQGGVVRRDRRSGWASFDHFFQTWYGRICAQLHAYLGDREEAEDVVQEAFLRAWQRWSNVGGYEDPVAWVRRVAWNLGTSRLRRIRVAALAQRRQGTPDPAPAADADHLALVEALRRLPEQQRRVIVLHYIGDIPVLEIADQLGIPKGTVLSWLHRGRERLAVQLGAGNDDPHTGGAEAVTS